MSFGLSFKKPKAPPGYLGELSDEQEQVLHQVRQWMECEIEDAENPWYTDTWLLRFCRARKFDFDKIKLMLEDYMHWKRENDLDGIITGFQLEEKEQVYEFYQRGRYGTDLLGRPVYIERCGKIKPHKVFEIISEELFWKDSIQTMEMVIKSHYMACSLVSQQQIFHTFTILDLAGFAMSQMNSRVYSIIQKNAMISQNYYPEQLGLTMIVNAPWTFSAVWSIIKGWLDENTRKKIQIVSGNPTQELVKYMDIEQIPEFLGGNNSRPLGDDHGPWDDFEIIDGCNKGDIVGIRRKGDGPTGKIFTPQDLEALPNMLLEDPQNSVKYAAQRRQMQFSEQHSKETACTTITNESEFIRDSMPYITTDVDENHKFGRDGGALSPRHRKKKKQSQQLMKNKDWTEDRFQTSRTDGEQPSDRQKVPFGNILNKNRSGIQSNEQFGYINKLRGNS